MCSLPVGKSHRFALRSHARNASHIPPKRTPPTTQNPIPCPINGADPNRVNPKPKPTQNQKPKPRTKQKQRQAEPHKKLDKKLSSSSALFPRTLRSTRNTWHVRGHISEEATRAPRTTRPTQGLSRAHDGYSLGAAAAAGSAPEPRTPLAQRKSPKH